MKKMKENCVLFQISVVDTTCFHVLNPPVRGEYYAYCLLKFCIFSHSATVCFVFFFFALKIQFHSMKQKED